MSHRSRRDRGHHHRRPRGRGRQRPDQDRRAGPQRAGREVQPAAAHRGGARRRRPLRRRPGVPAISATDEQLGEKPVPDAKRPDARRRTARPAKPGRPGDARDRASRGATRQRGRPPAGAGGASEPRRSRRHAGHASMARSRAEQQPSSGRVGGAARGDPGRGGVCADADDRRAGANVFRAAHRDEAAGGHRSAATGPDRRTRGAESRARRPGLHCGAGASSGWGS